MLARIRKPSRFPAAQLLSLAALAGLLASCATRPEPQLVSDPSATQRETALPWNEQEKWEQAGQLGPMAEKMGSDRR